MSGWRQLVRELKKENDFLKARVDELERKLAYYENPHTPPSKSKIKPPKKESNKKLGAPKGHPKYERPEPEPTGSVEYTEHKCPDCNADLEKPFKTERVIEEEIPEPQPVEVIEHLVNHYKCRKLLRAKAHSV